MGGNLTCLGEVMQTIHYLDAFLLTGSIDYMQHMQVPMLHQVAMPSLLSDEDVQTWRSLHWQRVPLLFRRIFMHMKNREHHPLA